MSLSRDGLLVECVHPLSADGTMKTGVQRLYRWGQGGLSFVNHPAARSFPFAWEVAVIRFESAENQQFHLDYTTPLTKDVEVFATEDEAETFRQRAKAYFLAHDAMSHR